MEATELTAPLRLAKVVLVVLVVSSRCLTVLSLHKYRWSSIVIEYLLDYRRNPPE